MATHPPSPQKPSRLPTVALILACLFFVPLVPLVGAILGIVAMVRKPPGSPGSGKAIAAIAIGLVLGLFSPGVLAAIAIPAFLSYIRRAKAIEAEESLVTIRAGAESAARSMTGSATGAVAPASFPVATTDWTPPEPCCDSPAGDARCQPSPPLWSVEPWRSLGFSYDLPHYFQVRYQSDGQTMTAEAQGDLDCDGVYSTYRLSGRMQGGRAVFDPIVEPPRLD